MIHKQVEETIADAAEVHGFQKIYAVAASLDRIGLGCCDWVWWWWCWSGSVD
jgi:hypothetical protein